MKPLHADALLQQRVGEARQAIGARRQFAVVVLRNQAAHRHARADVEQRQHGVEDRAADVLEIDVDAVRAGVGQLSREVRRAPVEAHVEAERAGDVAAFFGVARDADHAAAFQLRDLADGGAHRAARGGHHDRFARLRLADLQESRIGGEARHPEDAQRMRRMLERRAERHQVGAVRQRIVLPAAIGEHEVADGERRVLRRDHTADRAADHHVAERDRRRIGRRVAHAPAHVGVERQVERLQQDFAAGRRGNRGGLQAEVLRDRRAGRTAGQHEPAIDCFGV